MDGIEATSTYGYGHATAALASAEKQLADARAEARLLEHAYAEATRKLASSARQQLASPPTTTTTPSSSSSSSSHPDNASPSGLEDRERVWTLRLSQAGSVEEVERVYDEMYPLLMAGEESARNRVAQARCLGGVYPAWGEFHAPTVGPTKDGGGGGGGGGGGKGRSGSFAQPMGGEGLGGKREEPRVRVVLEISGDWMLYVYAVDPEDGSIVARIADQPLASLGRLVPPGLMRRGLSLASVTRATSVNQPSSSSSSVSPSSQPSSSSSPHPQPVSEQEVGFKLVFSGHSGPDEVPTESTWVLYTSPERYQSIEDVLDAQRSALRLATREAGVCVADVWDVVSPPAEASLLYPNNYDPCVFAWAAALDAAVVSGFRSVASSSTPSWGPGDDGALLEELDAFSIMLKGLGSRPSHHKRPGPSDRPEMSSVGRAFQTRLVGFGEVSNKHGVDAGIANAGIPQSVRWELLGFGSVKAGDFFHAAGCGPGMLHLLGLAVELFPERLVPLVEAQDFPLAVPANLFLHGLLLLGLRSPRSLLPPSLSLDTLFHTMAPIVTHPFASLDLSELAADESFGSGSYSLLHFLGATQQPLHGLASCLTLLLQSFATSFASHTPERITPRTASILIHRLLRVFSDHLSHHRPTTILSLLHLALL